MKRHKMYFEFKDLALLFYTTFKSWNDKDPFRQSAVIAYYAIFSLPGLFVLIITIAGYFFGHDTVNDNILAQVGSTLGNDTAEQIKEMLIKVGRSKSTISGTIVGIATILVGATGVFVELQKTFNTIWEVKVVPQRGILPILKARLFSFGLILAIAFLLIISLIVSTALAALNNWIKVDSPEWVIFVLHVFNFIISIVVISILFGLMFKILPDAKIEWKHVWLGSLVTGLLFTMGKTALSFYFGKADPASAYGAAGSIILLLLWVSYSSMILFFGAEFTATYAKMYSNKVPPTEIARVYKE